MRNTSQKKLILSIVSESHDHLNAYEIYEKAIQSIPNISLGTVYRNLANLANENKIIKINIDGIDRYDKNTKHAHFICNSCGIILDIFDDDFDKIKYVDDNLVTDYEFCFKGICKKCQERNDSDGIKRK